MWPYNDGKALLFLRCKGVLLAGVSLCQGANGLMALCCTTIWSFSSCGLNIGCSATQTLKEWNKHLSMCVLSPEGKMFSNLRTGCRIEICSTIQADRRGRGRLGGFFFCCNWGPCGFTRDQMIGDIVILLSTLNRTVCIERSSFKFTHQTDWDTLVFIFMNVW